MLIRFFTIHNPEVCCTLTMRPWQQRLSVAWRDCASRAAAEEKTVTEFNSWKYKHWVHLVGIKENWGLLDVMSRKQNILTKSTMNLINPPLQVSQLHFTQYQYLKYCETNYWNIMGCAINTSAVRYDVLQKVKFLLAKSVTFQRQKQCLNKKKVFLNWISFRKTFFFVCLLKKIMIKVKECHIKPAGCEMTIWPSSPRGSGGQQRYCTQKTPCRELMGTMMSLSALVPQFVQSEPNWTTFPSSKKSKWCWGHIRRHSSYRQEAWNCCCWLKKQTTIKEEEFEENPLKVQTFWSRTRTEQLARLISTFIFSTWRSQRCKERSLLWT